MAGPRKTKNGGLCKLEDLPNHLQFNKDILTGYRRPMSKEDCVRSWAYLHNESFNCYSHCFALLYFVFATRDYWTIWPTGSSTSTSVKLFIAGDVICTIIPFLFSIIYHTFMPHSSGETTYKKLLKIDILGIWWACTFGPLPSLYSGMYCTPNLMLIYLIAYSAMSAFVLYYLMVVDCKQKRTTALTVQFALRVMIHPLRLSSLSHSSTAGVFYHMIMDAFSAMGALINAFHVPERWFPGKFDYILNGHTIMHVVALLCIVIGRQGFLLDMQWLNDVHTCPSVVHDLTLATVNGVGKDLIHSLNWFWAVI